MIFAIFLYPVVTKLVSHIHEKNLLKRVHTLVDQVEHAEDEQELIHQLEQWERFVFFRITLYNPTRGELFDSHQEVEEEELETFPEIQEALEKGQGYAVRYSSLFDQQLILVAVAFPFKGETYVLRAAFPNGQIIELTRDLTVTFLVFVVILLLLFSFLAWFIIHYLTRPAFQILDAIRPYQEGREEHIREIHLQNKVSEFGQLAATLNSLSKRVENQIETLTEEKNEKSAILESLIEGVVAVDAKMTVIYMNQTAQDFLGIEQDLIGRSFSMIGQKECEQLIVQAQQTNHPALAVLKPKRGKKQFFDLVAIPRGQQEGAILVLQDKTALHKVIEMGRDFIANASHELKTPITIIRGFAETLHEHPELSREICHEITHKMVASCERMETLIRNLLTLASVDEGLPTSRLQKTDLEDLVEQAKQTTLVVHPHANIVVKTEGTEPFILYLDSDLFLQAILNLMDNAAKYSKPPANVTVRIIKREKEFVLQIADKGIGIPQEDLDRIFERFFAVDKSHSRSLGGSGLGLSIVSRIIEKHRGKIDVKSQKGKGTTFIITVPIPDMLS